jgi:hypothetical protein
MFVGEFISLIPTMVETGMAIYDAYKSRKDTTVGCFCIVRSDGMFCHCKMNGSKNISFDIKFSR